MEKELNFKDFNPELSESDKSQILEMVKDNRLSNRVYQKEDDTLTFKTSKDGSMELFKSFIDEKGEFKQALISGYQFSVKDYIPQVQSFEYYKVEFEREALNKDEFSEAARYLLEEKYAKLDKTEFDEIIFAEKYLIALFYNKEKGEFSFDVNGKWYKVNSYLLALKFSFEHLKYKTKLFDPDMMKWRLKLLDDYLQTEEGQKSIEEHFINKPKREEERLKSFYDSASFHEIYIKILEELKESNCINGTTLYNMPNIYKKINHEEFSDFVQSVFMFNESVQNEDGISHHVFFGKLMLEKSYVQGTETTIYFKD